MNHSFACCADAIHFALESQTYGVFESVQKNPDLTIHLHESCELLVCYTGGKRFLIDERVYAIPDGSLFLINPFEAHKITCLDGGDFHRAVLEIDPHFLFSHSTDSTDLSTCFFTRTPATSHYIALSKEDADFFARSFSALQSEKGFGGGLFQDAIILQILVVANELFLKNNPTDSRNMPGKNKIAFRAISYINAEYCNQITLEDIAAHCFVSVSHLSEVFRTYLGTTVMQYVGAKKIALAKKLLKSGSSVTETAFACGYTNCSSFIRAFTRYVGTPPRKYSLSADADRHSSGDSRTASAGAFSL